MAQINLGTRGENSLTVIVVEDRQKQSQLIEMMLNKIGIMDVAVFTSARKALAYFNDDPKRVSLIISDFNMPEMNGTELLEQVRESKINYKVPFVLISGVNTTQPSLLATDKGADAFLSKPFTVEQLSGKIKKFFLSEG
jgi:two-component system chemotaxis response regulator CheY